jgi:hypothetical protein
MLGACGGGGGGSSAPPPPPPPPVDTTPDAFQFQASVDAARGTTVTSAAATIAGINAAAAVSIENGEYSIAGGAFTAAAGTISSGQTLTLRALAGATWSKVTRVRVTVGGVTSTFDVVAELPNYIPDSIVYDGQDVVYLLCKTNKLVFRWSVGQGHYLDPYTVGLGALDPVKIAYSSAHQRLYLGYDTGAIQYIAATGANQAEVAYASTPLAVNGLVAVGNFMMAQDASGAWATHYIINNAGVITDQAEWNYYSREYAWDPANSRVYFFRDDTSPNDLHFEVINQTTGEIAAVGETPYHGEYGISPPIRVSASGQYVLLGTGDIYDQNGLTWSGSVGAQLADARWFANNSIVTLTTAGSQSTLRRTGAGNLTTLEQLTFTGQALRVIGTDTKMAVLLINNNTVQIQNYVPNDDSDGDGVTNTQDAFPLDRAASVDSDRDGYPDAWNAGRSQTDSTTGLALDAYPQDSACYLPAHGNGTVCDYGATIPAYLPDQIVQNGDVVYLLSTANKRVYRWSIATGAYLNPYVVGLDQGFTTLAPRAIGFSENHHRLYLGYTNGAIRYIDTNAATPSETPFANTSTGVLSLVSAGKYMLASTGNTSYVFDSGGAITAQGWGYYYGGYSSDYGWDPGTSRIYFFRDGLSPNDLHFSVIDQSNGHVTSSGETPYHGSYNIMPPIRVSPNGQHVLLGSGDIYAQNGLTWSGSLGAQVIDARWFANGSLVTLISSGNQTTLRRLAATNLATLEQLSFTGQALRVVGSDTRMVVLLADNGALQFRSYVPNDDSDGDTVLNTVDAFPLDVAASVDSDHDGFPDAWNPGRSQADSTTGLILDAFPQDAACWLPAHGSGGVCNYGATIPAYTPDQVVQSGDVIYLLSSANKRVYRWSISTAAYLNPYVIGINQGFTTVAPTVMAYSPAHQRLYFGYETGAIRYIDVTSGNGTEVPYANTALGVGGLASVGNFMLAQDHSGAWATHYIINNAGVITDQAEWNYYSREYAWDPVNSRVYFLRDDTSPNDLHYEVINQATGEIASAGESPYHGDYGVAPPIRVSASGQYVLLGTGDIYDQNGLSWSGSVGAQLTDARWFANGSLVTLTTTSNQTTLRRLGATNLATLEQLTYTGQALRVVGTDAKMVVLVLNNGAVQFQTYVPNDDSDGDGVTNTQDAFPLDKAASVDTDRDGYPDAWNAGKTQADSTTGLTLDAFPNDAACWLAAHGSGGVCNYSATIPNYTPDAVAQNGDTLYLLSSANKRVYRRTVATGAYLNPYIVGINQGFSTVAPTTMAYSPNHHRLYLGYSTGAIRYIDVNAATPVETPFATEATGVLGLVSAGNYLLGASSGNSYVFDSSGAITAQGWGYYYGGYSSGYAWDPVTSRIYFFRDGLSPNDLHYAVIDQANGLVTSAGETPYHGSYSIQPPIRVSASGQNILLGSGDFYSQNGLTWSGSLGMQVTDARWLADGSLVTLTTASNQTTLRRLASTNLAVLEQLTFAGTAFRVVGADAKMVVLVINSGTVQFVDYVPNNDSDNDGVPNTADAFPLDRAASVDTDRDGYPDAWNAGRTQADSTTGLTLDAFPNDSACWLASHGSGGVCNYGATIPNYIPDQVVSQGNTVYLLSITNKRVYRWSIATGQYLNPYIVGINQGFSTLAPTKMAYSPGHQRLYLAYDTGAIRYIDVNAASPVETQYANVATQVGGLAAVGNFMLAQDFSGAWATHYVINSAGIITDQAEWNYYSTDFAWDPGSSRVYFFRDNMSPNDLHYEEINQTTGEIASAGESPYHGEYVFSPPIRVSTDGQQILTGAGDIYQRPGLTHVAALGKAVKDAYWKDSTTLVDLDTTDRVEIRDANSRAVLAFYQYLGTPIRIVFGTSEAYLVHVSGGSTAFVRLPFYDQDADQIPRWWETLYGLSDTNAGDATGDIDGDGVNNRTEYQNHSNPTVADTDGDGLSDQQEIVTYTTDPARADTDGDGLNDREEIITWHSDPKDTDSDNDGYNDFDEVTFGGDPNDPAGLPQPITSYSQTFESNPNLAAWTQPVGSAVPWALDPTTAHAGTASFKSGTPSTGFSGVKLRRFFSAGTLSFWSKVEEQGCCYYMSVLIDGNQVLYLSANSAWTNYSAPVTLGIHDVEWRFQQLSSGIPQGINAAWIDDVSFAGQ